MTKTNEQLMRTPRFSRTAQTISEKHLAAIHTDRIERITRTMSIIFNADIRATPNIDQLTFIIQRDETQSRFTTATTIKFICLRPFRFRPTHFR